jgi:ribosomal protein L9
MDDYRIGYIDGVASRDAEVVSLTNQRDYEYVRAENAEQERDQFEQERDQLRAHINDLREALTHSDTLLRDLPNSGGFYGLGVMENNAEALSSTPELSLARLRNQVREESVKLCWYDMTPKQIADAIRATKEQE